MRQAPVLVLGVAIAALGSAGAVLAFQKNDPPNRGMPVVASVLGDEQPGLDARMARAEKRGPYSLACNPGTGSRLVCTQVKDEDVIPALKRGETIYGRTVLGFSGGAEVGKDAVPTFEATDLVCATGSGHALPCIPVTAATPTVRAGQWTLSFYKKHDVTFNERGLPVGHLGPPTVPLRVLPSS